MHKLQPRVAQQRYALEPGLADERANAAGEGLRPMLRDEDVTHEGRWAHCERDSPRSWDDHRLGVDPLPSSRLDGKGSQQHRVGRAPRGRGVLLPLALTYGEGAAGLCQRREFGPLRRL